MITHLFLDRDGIINEVVMRQGVISSPRHVQEFRFRKDFLDCLDRFKKIPHLYIVSNQPDIARGLMAKDVLENIDNLIRNHIRIDKISYCMHDNSDCCNCRKPKPGLITEIIESNCLDRSTCAIVGDSEKDIQAGINAGIKTIFLQTQYNQHIHVAADFKIFSLYELFTSKIL